MPAIPRGSTSLEAAGPGGPRRQVQAPLPKLTMWSGADLPGPPHPLGLARSCALCWAGLPRSTSNPATGRAGPGPTPVLLGLVPSRDQIHDGQGTMFPTGPECGQTCRSEHPKKYPHTHPPTHPKHQ